MNHATVIIFCFPVLARTNGQSTVGSKVYSTWHSSRGNVLDFHIHVNTLIRLACLLAFVRRCGTSVGGGVSIKRKAAERPSVGGRRSPFSYSRRRSDQRRPGRRRRLPGDGIESFGRRRNIPMKMRNGLGERPFWHSWSDRWSLVACGFWGLNADTPIGVPTKVTRRKCSFKSSWPFVSSMEQWMCFDNVANVPSLFGSRMWNFLPA